MAINNGIGTGFQPQQYYTYPSYQQSYPQNSQPLQQVMPQNSSVNNGRIWVQGINAARSYLLAPNTSADLWDSEEQVIYLKSVDAYGMPSMKILDYTIRDEHKPAQSPLSGNEEMFATKEDISNLRAEMEKVRNQISSISNRNSKERKEQSRNE